MTEKTTISFRVSKAWEEKIKEYAENRNLTIGQAVRECIKFYFEGRNLEEKIRDLERRLNEREAYFRSLVNKLVDRGAIEEKPKIAVGEVANPVFAKPASKEGRQE